jgi:ATP-binding cassette subfamily B protein
MLILTAFTVLLIFGGMEAVAGRMSVGTYSVLVFLVQLLLWPLTRLGDTFDLYQRAMASTNRIMDLLATQIAIHPGDVSLPVETVRGDVEFKNVSFAYQDRQAIIENLSLHIPAEKQLQLLVLLVR